MQLQWTKPAIAGPALEAEFNGGRIELWIEDREGQARPAFIVHRDGSSYTTENTEDWPDIESVIPRSKWPEPMYVGQRGPKERCPDKAVADAVAAYQAELDEE